MSWEGRVVTEVCSRSESSPQREARPGRCSKATVIAPGYPTIEIQRAVVPVEGRPGAVVGGRYHLHGLLGRGGIGEVWEATDPEGRPVAIKLLQAEYACDVLTLERFLREGQLSAALHHPHIVRVYEVGGLRGDAPFLAMERLCGPSLEDVVIEQGALSWARARGFLLQICDALEHAHRTRIVHHDVKPSNIVIASAPGQPEQGKLVDFGIARRNLVQEPDVQLTMEGQILGSPGYISPEQLRGHRSNHRSDIYGLGCTAYHLLTGRPPIEAETLPDLLHAALFTPPPALGPIEGTPRQRIAIETAIHRALAKDPAERFTSARHMAQALAAIEP